MEILPEIEQRISSYVFKSDEVEPEKVKALVEAARLAPSCFNNQEWNYIFVHKDDPQRNQFENAFSLGNEWAIRAPILVAVASNPSQDCKTNGLPYYAYDAGLSVMSLVIEAEHQGLRVHQMAGYNEENVKKALMIPEGYRVIVLFAVGYEGEIKGILDALTDKVKNRLTRARTRKPVSDNFFKDRFGERLNF